MPLLRLVQQTGWFTILVFLPSDRVKEQTFYPVDNAQISHAPVFSGGRKTSICFWFLVRLNRNPERLFRDRRRQPRRRLHKTVLSFVSLERIRLGCPNRNRIPPPDAGIHIGFSEKVAAVVLEFVDHILAVAQNQRMVRIQLFDHLVKRDDIRQLCPPSRYALFRAPAQQAGMMPKRENSSPDLAPVPLLNCCSRQFHHHSHL